MEKESRLQKLLVRLQGDKSLPLQESRLVFGEGDINSAIMFIGEAPGEKENELQRPFVGRAGQLLDKLLSEVGWPRSSVYITNIVKRRPPANRDPLSEEIEAYKPYLSEQISIISPKVVIPLGRFSMNYFLPTAKISKDQGKIFRLSRYCIVPMFHPAAALRNPATMNELRVSFSKLPKIITMCEDLLKASPTQKDDKQTDNGYDIQKTLF